MISRLGATQSIGWLRALKANEGKNLIYWSKFGFGRVQATFSTIYSQAVAPGIYPRIAEPAKMAFASTDPDDTELGTGGRYAIVQGLDENFELQTELITMNGQTPVLSKYNYHSRVFYGFNRSKSGHKFQGTFYGGLASDTWVGGEPSTPLMEFSPEYQRTQMCIYTVPKGYKLLIENYSLSGGRGDEIELGFFVRDSVVAQETENYEFTAAVNYLLYNSPIVIDLNTNPFVIDELTDFEARAKNNTGGTISVTANMSGVLVPNHYFGDYTEAGVKLP